MVMPKRFLQAGESLFYKSKKNAGKTLISKNNSLRTTDNRPICSNVATTDKKEIGYSLTATEMADLPKNARGRVEERMNI